MLQRYLYVVAWAWMIIVGGLLITPGGVFCIVCGPSIKAPGYIGDPAVPVIGIVSIALGILGFGIMWRGSSSPHQ